MGCFVCGKDHGTRHFINICGPVQRYQQEMERRAQEMRDAAATLQPKFAQPCDSLREADNRTR